MDTVLRVRQEPATIAQTRVDFVRARSLGVRSFPALLSENGELVIEVSGGYATAAQLTRQLHQILAMAA
jgi:putative protein-disulfide isomerase